MREQRLAFGEEAELYDRVRPSYPPELIDDLVALVGAPYRVLDVGCGTGKASVMLAERNGHGVGVEPDSAMAAIAAQHLRRFGGWRVDVSDFESWRAQSTDLPFDLITVAQALHWINRERGTRQAERLLRSGGWLAVFGHAPDPADTPLRREIDGTPRRTLRSRARTWARAAWWRSLTSYGANRCSYKMPHTRFGRFNMSAEAAEHGKHHEVTIVVDGTPHVWAEKEISYEQVVDLAYDGSPPTGENVEITVGFHRGHGEKPEGDLEPGQSVKVKDGMVFDVTATDRS